MLFDTHCHTYLSNVKNETEILNEIKEKWNLYIANIWVDLETSQHNIKLSEQYDFVYATVWVHPCDVSKYPDLNNFIEKLELLAKNKKVVAIWECWLDYYRLPPRLECEMEIETIKSLQKEFFIAQIELAKKLNLPLVIHNRESKDDIFEILEKTDFKNFIMHCYSEDLEYAHKLLRFAPECMISFSWIVTFNSAKNTQETASKIPLKNILIETDSPYLAPAPFRGQENYPYLVEKVFDKICELRSESKEEIEKAIWDNSLGFYGVKKS